MPIGGGAACWVVIYLLLPKPMWIYVFGHELTHALWVWLFGGSVKKFKVTSDGGHVIVDKTNFLIALSPYFFRSMPSSSLLVSSRDISFGIGRLLRLVSPADRGGLRVSRHTKPPRLENAAI